MARPKKRDVDKVGKPTAIIMEFQETNGVEVSLESINQVPSDHIGANSKGGPKLMPAGRRCIHCNATLRLTNKGKACSPCERRINRENLAREAEEYRKEKMGR
jgi:hypothetical protein